MKEIVLTKLNGESVKVNLEDVECYRGSSRYNGHGEYTRFYMKDGSDFGVRELFSEVDNLFDPRV